MNRFLFALALCFIPTFASAQNVKLPKAVDTRVVVVNVGQVLAEYTKAQKFKRDLEEATAPFDAQVKRHERDIARWQKALDEQEFIAHSEKELRATLAVARKQLATLQADLEGEIAKFKEKQVPPIWQNIQAAIKAEAIAHKIDLVLGHGDPTDAKKLDHFDNVHRKMQAMDLGGTVPLYVSPRANLSRAVIARLNGTATKVGSRGGVRVAVVNVGAVFHGFEKAIRVKQELIATLEPFKESARKHLQVIREGEEKLLLKDFENVPEDQLRANVKNARKQLENLENKARDLLGKKQEDNLVLLWVELQNAIKTYAQACDIDIVLGYGEPLEEKLFQGLDNITRKRRAMNSGISVPLYVGGNAEIAPGVLLFLNQPNKKHDAPRWTTASRVTLVNMVTVYSQYQHAKELRKEEQEQRALGAKIHAVWHEIQKGINAIASEQRTTLALGHGASPLLSTAPRYDDVNRLLHAMDCGAMLPLYFNSSIEHAPAVVDLLNASRDPKRK